MLTLAATTSAAQAPVYSIEAIRYANSPGDAVADMVMGAPEDEKIESIYAIWLIRGGGRNILFDKELIRINADGRLRLVDGDDQEIIPGIRVYTGARHTYASQYLRVNGNPAYVLASDNVYLYRNLTTHSASATFSDADHAANVAAQRRMSELAGSPDRIVPGHDALQFQRFPTEGRIARIR